MWLKGSSDCNNLRQDLYDLLTGAIVAGQRGSGQVGNGAQVAAPDAWTGLDAANFIIRAPSGADWTPWTLPITCWRGMPRFTLYGTPAAGMVAAPQMGKPTFSGVYNGAATRAYYHARVTTANSSPGDLTGTVVTYAVYNTDTNASLASGTLSGWTGASDTKAIGYGSISLTLTLTGGQTFEVAAIGWYRGYSLTLTDGVDYIAEAATIDTSATLKVGNTSGSANDYTRTTDYDLAQTVDDYPAPTAMSASYWPSDRGNYGLYSGIHWKTGGTPAAVGATYYLNACSNFSGYLGIGYVSSPTPSGYACFVPIEFWDATAHKGRNVGSYGATTAPVYSTAYDARIQIFNGVITGATYVNFWISVKKDKIVIVLRGDPGNLGYIGWFTFQSATALTATEKNNWVVGSSSWPILGPYIAYHYTLDKPQWGLTGYGSLASSPNIRAIYPAASSGQPAGLACISSFPTCNPGNMDDKWWLYAIYVQSNYGGKDTSGNYTSSYRQTGYRFSLNGMWAIGQDNWSSLDELVDGGDTYLLVQPSVTIISSCGQAILEE